MKKALKIILIILSCIALIIAGISIAHYICNLSLRKYIASFDPVAYEERLEPVVSDGYYTFVTDDDLKVMHITDIHISGGMWTYKRDKKSIYEVITMLQKEKPDLVILGGDNTYCVPTFGYNGGFTFNNKMVAKTVIEIFEHEEVYFTTVFGNHDTEPFDFADRQEVAQLYMDEDYMYCIFEECFTDPDADTVPSASNQFILVKNTSGDITKLLIMLDTNAYMDTRFITSARMLYDTIHQSQIDWAESEIKKLSAMQGLAEGEYLKSLVFVHIPTGEYRSAMDDLITEIKDADGNVIAYEQNEDPQYTEFVEGYWDEDKIYFGGLANTDIAPDDQDLLFETLGLKLGSMEAMFCGHDHVNNAVVYYKGIMLSYGYSVDNTAYGNAIASVGSQRGATVITVHPDGSFEQVHKNAYTDYGCDPNLFVEVDPDAVFYPKQYRTVQ